ncbi:endonuclease/exonuclease/phosphatase family protein [Paenarthrobacter ureafaciens]|uniref:endonuclease/exonuclease/phosphatase family protein n=1 Tax=Paenarthrobacter ureafaciens TaxID=37931 RepID=UPI001C2BE33A|nr:endonuclease/exonuclease/phosphatase family protein [Paenarthrobacter ureafaciens]
MTEAAALPVVRSRRPGAPRVWTVLALLLVLPVVVLSVFRAVPAEWPLLVVQLVAFTPWLVVPAGLAVHLFWLFPLDYGRPEPLPEGRQAVPVTVMTLNSEFGQADADEVVRLVREKSVQVLAVQEFSQALQDRLEQAGLPKTLPHLVSDPTDDAAGNALYSVFPLEYAGRLPDSPFHMPVVRVDARLDGLSAAFTLTSVHTLPPVDERLAQWRSDLESAAWQAGAAGRQVFMGDFNATYDHREFRDFLASGRDGSTLVDAGVVSWGRLSPTWPMEGPALPGIVLDHVVTTPQISSTGYAVHRVAGTDHAALVATLQVPAR